MNKQSPPHFFAYSESSTSRRHGPLGYSNYSDFKPWLRDEFSFRCVFCLIRERLYEPDGEDKFAVEHVRPRASRPDLTCDYDNLVYACTKCNSFKSTLETVLHPCDDALGEHLEVRDDGTIHAMTEEGADFIRVLRLDREELTTFRRNLLNVLRAVFQRPTDEVAAYIRSLLSFPDRLPDLKRLRPPGGNARPEGVADCCFERRRRGELPEAY